MRTGLSTVLVCWSLSLMAGATEEPIEDRLGALETRITALEEQPGRGREGDPVGLADLRRELRLDLRAASVTGEQKWNTLDARLLRVESLWNLFIAVVGFSVLTCVCTIWLVPRWAEKRTLEKLDRKTALLEEVLTSAGGDREIRSSERVWVFSRHAESKVVAHLRRLGFQGITPVLAGPSPSESWIEAQRGTERGLVVFDQLSDEWINTFVAQTDDPAFVSYHLGKARQEIRDPERMSYANTPMTLYARILEAARFRRSMSQTG